MVALGEAACALSAGALGFALTLAWLRQPVSPGRFLLYDVKFGEGFNLQREVFPRAAWLVGELNKELEQRCGEEASVPECLRWAVVLPPWCRVAHWDTGPEPRPWSEFFDAAALRSARVPVMEFHEYAQTAGRHVDLAVALAEDTPKGQRFVSGGAGKFRHFARDLAPCSTDAGGRGIPRHERDPATGRVNLTYAGSCKGGLTAGELRCGVLDSPFPGGVVDMLRKLNSSHVRSVILKNYDALLSPDDEELDSYGLRESMLFSSEIRQQGEEFIASALEGRPYLSAHCRRTDFLHVRARTTPAADAVAAQLNAALEASGLDQVFVATDAPEDLKTELQAQVRRPVRFFEPGPVWLHPGRRAAVEMWLAARADVFVGTAESRFTMWIQLERGFLGWPTNTSEQEFCKTAGTQRCISPKNRHPKHRAANRRAYLKG